MSQRLLRPQVPLGGLDRGMAEEQLDLLQLPARLAAEFGAGPAQVVRRELAQSGGLGITHHQAPDCLFVPESAAILVSRSPGYQKIADGPSLQEDH
jgi:hypothetical protein